MVADTQTEQNRIARLVQFLICLGIAGGLCAGILYYNVGLPMQQALQPPTNVDCKALYTHCGEACLQAGAPMMYCREHCYKAMISCQAGL